LFNPNPGYLEKVDIHARISEVKMQEFRQSLQVFLSALKQTDGYLGYTENPGALFSLSIDWESRQQLDSFMESELFHFLKGAIKTLGQLTKISILSSNNTTNFSTR
jgi:quinol monooxygenase YgiN